MQWLDGFSDLDQMARRSRSGASAAASMLSSGRASFWPLLRPQTSL